MFHKFYKFFDWPLFVATLLLSLIGIMMIYSTGLGDKTGAFLWVRQATAMGFGVLGLLFLSRLDYNFFHKAAGVLYVLSLILLVLVLFFGQEIRGAARWFDFGFFSFQPAEFSKLALIVFLANFLRLKQPMLQKFRYVLWSGVYPGIIAVLLMLQPDLGSAIIHVAIWTGLLLISPAPRRFLLYLLVIFLIISAASWVLFLRDYQKDRIRSFVNPAADPQGQGYNVLQSIVAVGAGGIYGRGLARGPQSQLQFLPERQTDFIFASLVEELGFIGGGLVLVLFFLVFVRLIKIAGKAREIFGAYLVGGFFFLILTQILVNVGMNLGLVPVTGVTLPFLSYGGSSLLLTFLLVGMVQSVARRSLAAGFG